MKKRYRIRNWKDYNKALRQRGSLNFWISEDILEKWKNPEVSGKRGRPQLYSDPVILSRVMVKAPVKRRCRQAKDTTPAASYAPPGSDLFRNSFV